jgi:hypothetical protein
MPETGLIAISHLMKFNNANRDVSIFPYECAGLRQFSLKKIPCVRVGFTEVLMDEPTVSGANPAFTGIAFSRHLLGRFISTWP